MPISTRAANFNEVAEAYEVLSSPVLRTHYDLHGGERLKEGFSDSERIHIGAYKYSGDPSGIFHDFILKSSPFADLVDSEGYLDSSSHSSMFGFGFGGLKGDAPPVPENLRVEVSCSLEELYNGCSKAVTYKRLKHNQDRRTTRLTEITRKLLIKPGYSEGTELIFPKEGHDALNASSSDLIFIIKEQTHPLYTRHGNNLSCTVEVSLQDIIDCYPVEVTTLDGRHLVLTLTRTHNQTLTVANEGMPVFSSTDPLVKTFGQDFHSRKRGLLQVKLVISMPERILHEETDSLRVLLGS